MSQSASNPTLTNSKFVTGSIEFLIRLTWQINYWQRGRGLPFVKSVEIHGIGAEYPTLFGNRISKLITPIFGKSTQTDKYKYANSTTSRPKGSTLLKALRVCEGSDFLLFRRHGQRNWIGPQGRGGKHGPKTEIRATPARDLQSCTSAFLFRSLSVIYVTLIKEK